MSIDKHVAERRRFARLLGTDDAVGSGLPIGPGRDDGDPADDSDDGSRDVDDDRRAVGDD